MSFSVKVKGVDDFGEAVQNIAEALGPPHVTQALKRGAEVIQHQAQQNVKRQKLYVTGTLHDSIKVLEVSPWAVSILVDVVYGAVHEFGYTGIITDKQRRFFWAKWYETQDDMWKALALSYSYTIPARPYLRPAVDQKMGDAILTIVQQMRRALQLGIRRK